MAIDIESFNLAWCQMQGNIGGIYNGDGIESVTRNGVGDYTIVLTQAIDTEIATPVLTPQAGAAGAPSIGCVQFLSQTEVQLLFCDIADATAPADPAGWSFALFLGNTETPTQAVI